MPQGRRRRSPQQPTATPGGSKLRQLREQAKRTLADVEARTDYKIGSAHLHRIERGTIQRPDFETLHAILTALNARFIDRRDVFEAFGYRVPHSLPTEDEIREAIQLCSHELTDAIYPVYLIDDGQRLLAWNRYVPRLIGMHPDDPALALFVGVTTIDLAFNPRFVTSSLLVNRAEYLPMLLHFIKTGLQAYEEEPWYVALIEHARQLPSFAEMWDSLPEPTMQRVATQTIIPLQVNVPNVGPLEFRLTSSAFILDPRFQLIHYVPYGATTLRKCAIWAAEGGV